MEEQGCVRLCILEGLRDDLTDDSILRSASVAEREGERLAIGELALPWPCCWRRREPERVPPPAPDSLIAQPQTLSGRHPTPSLSTHLPLARSLALP